MLVGTRRDHHRLIGHAVRKTLSLPFGCRQRALPVLLRHPRPRFVQQPVAKSVQPCRLHSPLWNHQLIGLVLTAEGVRVGNHQATLGELALNQERRDQRHALLRR